MLAATRGLPGSKPYLLPPVTPEERERLLRELRAKDWVRSSRNRLDLETLSQPRDVCYELPNGDLIPFYRCDGLLVCWDCWRPYSDHPSDEREPCLTVLCNGWRVKL